MNTIRDAWFLIRSELMGTRIRLLKMIGFSLLIILYLGLFSGAMLQETLSKNEPETIADYLMLLIMPMMGFVYCRRSMKYWSSDTYTRTLSYLRGFPIPTATILCKRQLQALLAFCLNGLLFFGGLYALSSDVRQALPPVAYLAFLLTWVGYGLLMTGMFIHVELSYSGRVYFAVMLVLVLLCLGGAWLIGLADGSALLYTARVSKRWELGSPLMWGALAVGAASMGLTGRWTLRRMNTRDLL